MSIRKIIYAVLPLALPLTMALALTLAGCGKEPVDNPDGEILLTLVPKVGIEAAEQNSRALVDNTVFFPMLRYGIWIESLDAAKQPDNTSTAWYRNLGYDNILASRTAFSGYGSGWSFTLKNGSTTSARIGLFAGKGPYVNVYAIYPYRSDFSPETASAIPFTVGTTDDTNYDYMYTGAVEVPVMLSLTGITEIDTTLPFKHLMTLLEFRVSTTLIGSLQINKITLNAVDGGNNPVEIFCMSGTFNAFNGVISGNEKTDELTIEYNKKVAYSKMPSTNNQNNSQWTSFGFIFPAVEATLTQGTRLKVKFEFDYKNLDEDDDGLLIHGGEIELDLGNITTGGTQQGLMTNYRYIYTISVDNFIKYQGYPEVQPWYFEKDEGGSDDKIYDIIL